MKNKPSEVYHSISEFEKKYLPEAFSREKEKEEATPTALGTNLALKSLQKIQKRLSSL